MLAVRVVRVGECGEEMGDQGTPEHFTRQENKKSVTHVMYDSYSHAIIQISILGC